MNVEFLVAIVTGTVVAATPLIYAALGELIVERAGIRVTRDGLVFPGQTSITPQAAIRQIDLTPNRARIQLCAGGRTITFPVVASAGPWVLSLLLNRLQVQASFSASS